MQKVDDLFHIAFVLDAPASDVWPFILDWEKWLTVFRCNHVSGGVDQIGEVKKVVYLNEQEEWEDSFLAEIVRLVPGSRLVYKLRPIEKPSLPLENLHGYMIFNLYCLDDKTLITYESAAQFEVSQTDVETSYGQEHEEHAVDEWLEKYVPQLQKLLRVRGEGGPLDG